MTDKKPEAPKDSSKQSQKKEKPIKLSEDARMRLMLNNKMKEMETEFDLNEHIVIDLGNALTKIGFSGKDLPVVTIPSIYAKNKMADSDKKNEISAYEQKMDIFGYEALDANYAENYNINFLTPGDHKLPTSYEFLEFLKDALENKMGVSPTDYSVIVNISPIKNRDNIDIYGKIFLEELGFRAMALINSSSLSLFSTGRTSGLIVECGETRTYTVPLFEGFPLYHALNKSKLGGKDLTNVFKEGVVNNNFNVRPEDICTLRDIKEKTCSVPYLHPYEYYLDENNDDIISKQQMLYKLPDESIIEIPRQSRIVASELLFNPSVIGRNESGLKHLIVNSIKKSSIDNEKFKETLLNNIVLSGGTSMMHGFGERIVKDLLEYQDQDFEIDYTPNVIAENNRYISKWIGMSMIASMSAFDKIFIKKSEYQEYGEDRFSMMAKIF